ncbi:uncharacterized protein BXIN_0805 [Babesia sp. Xinjiang]|uniref:uncharacterized protein n=1 Tax=Babesia sp. Xinjiang TaxID=462227 RepID=UPI000A250186|nr:uncharacterized protein BXIN_0805 [Babesia sp. Xinjiang]ORM41306.1 hypothetical protein BXIN_0805 [Babesia sp. Xinjiang]
MFPQHIFLLVSVFLTTQHVRSIVVDLDSLDTPVGVDVFRGTFQGDGKYFFINAFDAELTSIKCGSLVLDYGALNTGYVAYSSVEIFSREKRLFMRVLATRNYENQTSRSRSLIVSINKTLTKKSNVEKLLRFLRGPIFLDVNLDRSARAHPLLKRLDSHSSLGNETQMLLRTKFRVHPERYLNLSRYLTYKITTIHFSQLLTIPLGCTIRIKETANDVYVYSNANQVKIYWNTKNAINITVVPLLLNVQGSPNMACLEGGATDNAESNNVYEDLSEVMPKPYSTREKHRGGFRFARYTSGCRCISRYIPG